MLFDILIGTLAMNHNRFNFKSIPKVIFGMLFLLRNGKTQAFHPRR